MLQRLVQLICFAFLILILASFAGEAQELNLYQGSFPMQKKNLISWHELDSETWFNAELWQEEIIKKEQDPLWELKERELLHREKVGKILSVKGVCQIFRGEHFVKAQFTSPILEGDEVKTLPGAYAWIFLVDGTLVRLAPESSISFNEIDISAKKFFIHARLNEGVIFWLSRHDSPLLEENRPETDTLFLPLDLFAANPELTEWEQQSTNLASYLEEDKRHLLHIQKLNKMLGENNSYFAHKPTEVLLSMVNGQISATNPDILFYVPFGYESYLKLYYQQKETESFFTFRGHQNEEVSLIPLAQWHEIAKDGKTFSPYESGDQQFNRIELSIKRVPTILIAREIWLKQESLALFDRGPLSDTFLEQQGYRLWDAKEGSSQQLSRDALDLRIDFLAEYTRRLETTNLSSVRTLVEQQKITRPVFDERYYQLAYQEYLNYIARGYKLNQQRRPLYDYWLQKKIVQGANK